MTTIETIQEQLARHTVAPMPLDIEDYDTQFQGLVIAATSQIRRIPTGFLIQMPDGEPVVCNFNFCPCDDFKALGGKPCVHVYAAHAYNMRESRAGKINIPDELLTYEHHMAQAPSVDTTMGRAASSAASCEIPVATMPPPRDPPRPPNLTMAQSDGDDYVPGKTAVNTDLSRISMNMDLPGGKTMDGSDGKLAAATPHPVWRKKVLRDMRQYEKAQLAEGRHFRELLLDLVRIVPEPEHSHLGRKNMPLGPIIYGLTMWVYGQKSLRRGMSDIDLAMRDGMLEKIPSRSSLSKYICEPSLLPVLSSLVEASAAPLRLLETTFAADSTSFASTWKADTWHQYKHGKENKKENGEKEEKSEKAPRNKWVKAHMISGVLSNIVTAAVVSPNETGDAPQLPDMLEATGKNFSILKLTGDKGYISKDNLEAVVAMGAHPYMPFKSDAVYRDKDRPGAELWNAMLWYFENHQEAFYAQYHSRSNVETTMSSIKRLMGPLVRSRTDEARCNEVMLKILAYNLVTLIHAIYELGVTPAFELPGEKG